MPLMNENYLKIKNLITASIDKFSAKQKKIANYFIENPQGFALKSVSELEKELNISKSTIVRMAQTLGFSGLLEMKRETKKYLSNQMAPLEKYEAILTGETQPHDYLSLLSDEVILNIKKTEELVDREQFSRFTEMLEKAGEVHTLGEGISMYIAEIAAYLLNRVSVKAFAFSRGGAPFPEQIINFQKSDLVLAFHFPAYSKSVKETVAFAKQRGLKILVITDKATNDIIADADEYLQVVVESCTISNSISSVITLLYAVIAEIGQAKKTKILKSLQSVKQLRE